MLLNFIIINLLTYISSFPLHHIAIMFASRVFRPAQQLSSVSPINPAIPARLTRQSVQHVRRYASEAPKSGGNNALLYGGIGAAALGGGYYYFSTQGVPKEAKVAASKVQNAVQGPAKKVFTGGDQGFVSLELEKVEDINDNTKMFRFKFPEADQVSGLAVASALVTKFKGPDMEKPVIRPYTPTSDEGASKS